MLSIRDQIARRSLTPGAKLPSIRAVARTMRVSKSTVVEAYDRLAAEGVIRSRPGSGFYSAAPLAPLSLAELAPRLDRAIDPFWVSRQSLEAKDEVLKPGCGWLPGTWMPEEETRRALRSLARTKDMAALTDYGTPLGLGSLRQLLSRRMAEQGFEARPEQILLTDSGTQAIDLVCRLLVQPGDVVLVDDPCYFNFLALLRAQQVHVIGVPYTPAGPNLQLFEEALARHRPRLYITNSGLHNPTGASLSAGTAHRLLRLAEDHDLIVIEDDIFADFEVEPAARLAALDGLDRVVRIGSFSKTLSASFRCGYIAARRDWIDKLTDLRIATGFASSRLSEELVFCVLGSSGYRKYLEALRMRLGSAMVAVAARLRSLDIEPWVMPKAGMLVWCRLPHGLDAAEVARHALSEGVVLAPGNVFSASQTASGFMRFNVAQCMDDRIFAVIEKAMRQAA
ncbi:PLP-dependent aminotransferase family protein [Microvirga mediterraneensis]|uniref:8-amino-7-oxononanoate synthase n=1 Tax=Microvirga mediterraneensis TaxID=2754695 RepID=A0A838BP74_9HYPH|nr:PLP-dependent aminotransferase family protein [Microvirga mediterraneensis]MBA1157347.1 PLP-dependent aminotransferase family protein [Microvirga mediterraneensis]